MEGWGGGTAHSGADTTADTDSTSYTAHNSTVTTADIAHSRYSPVDTTHITQLDRQNSRYNRSGSN
jgi:hypothetical protein